MKKTKYLKIIGISFAIGIALFTSRGFIQSTLFTFVWNSQIADEWFRDLVISQRDLPAGWIPTKLEYLDYANDPSIFVCYSANANKQFVQVVMQDLILYKNIEIATQAYRDKIASYKNCTFISLAKQEWRADQIYFSCSFAVDGTAVCDIVAQYENIVSALMAQVFVDRSLTQDEFVTVARRIDNRIHQYTMADN